MAQSIDLNLDLQISSSSQLQLASYSAQTWLDQASAQVRHTEIENTGKLGQFAGDRVIRTSLWCLQSACEGTANKSLWQLSLFQQFSDTEGADSFQCCTAELLTTYLRGLRPQAFAECSDMTLPAHDNDIIVLQARQSKSDIFFTDWLVWQQLAPS